MKYLSIEYKIDNIQEKHIKEIEIIISKYEEEYFNTLLKKFPDFPITKYYVVMSDDIWRDIHEFHFENDQTYERLRPKGIEHIVKIFTINNQTKYFWNVNYFNEDIIKLYFNLLIEDLLSNQLQEKYDIDRLLPIDQGIDSLILQLYKIWHVNKISKTTAFDISQTTELKYDSMEDFTFAFKKNIKNLHYDYQRAQDNYKFLTNSILELEIYIRRILSHASNENFKELDEFDIEVKEIYSCILDSEKNLSEIDINLLSKIKQQVVSILLKCDIGIYEDEKSQNIGFKIKEGPKKLFPDLIDTHPRIVCFIDILGFKALIEDYENINSSLVLKRLKKSFDGARVISFEMLTNILEPEFRKELEFRMFSDCIIISLPFIEFGIDIKKGIYNMALILNVFQQTFMREGFYLRGHLTIGSYYSDENMIFSGGLVEAYLNESDTTFPIISLNQKIINKIKIKHQDDDLLPSFSKMIIQHKYPSSKNKYFINPFFSINTYKSIDKQFNDIFNTGKDPETENDQLIFSFIDLFKSSLKNLGVKDLDQEIIRDKNLILDLILDNYKEQLQIYQNFNYSHKERTIASKILHKYEFLLSLYEWLEKNEGDMFEYMQLE